MVGVPVALVGSLVVLGGVPARGGTLFLCGPNYSTTAEAKDEGLDPV